MIFPTWSELSLAAQIAIGYLALINIVACVMYGVDKSYAVAGASRIRERTLLILAVLGGTLGSLLGMKLFHHKWRKTDFLLPFIIIVAIQLALVAYCVYRANNTPFTVSDWPMTTYWPPKKDVVVWY